VSPQGTAAYDGLTDLPPLVERAVAVARREGFANSCRPEQGRLLLALAAGAQTIGETGTGCGVGLAWLASGARPGTRLRLAQLLAQALRQLPSRRFSGAPAANVMWSNVAAHPSPVGDWARKPTRTISASRRSPG
jgi:hypothetical protein